MILHLDTSFVVDLLRERIRGAGPASEFLAGHLDDELAVSVFVECELFTGVERSDRPDEERQKIEAMLGAVTTVFPCEAFGPRYGRTLAALQRQGEVIAGMDLLIATTALTAGAPLVTGDVARFARVDGLRVLSYRG